MTRKQAVQRRDKLAARLPDPSEVLRGSLLERTVHHSSGCPKCARGEGYPLWVLNVNYPGASLNPSPVPFCYLSIVESRPRHTTGTPTVFFPAGMR